MRHNITLEDLVIFLAVDRREHILQNYRAFMQSLGRRESTKAHAPSQPIIPHSKHALTSSSIAQASRRYGPSLVPPPGSSKSDQAYLNTGIRPPGVHVPPSHSVGDAAPSVLFWPTPDSTDTRHGIFQFSSSVTVSSSSRYSGCYLLFVRLHPDKAV